MVERTLSSENRPCRKFQQSYESGEPVDYCYVCGATFDEHQLRTPQGEPALTQTDGLPGTREPVVIGPHGNAGGSPAQLSSKKQVSFTAGRFYHEAHGVTRPATDEEVGVELRKLQHEHEALLRGRIPTHRCKVCGALWICWAAQHDKYPQGHPLREGSWSLFSLHCGRCCDNAAMVGQIEPIQLAAPIDRGSFETTPFARARPEGDCGCIEHTNGEGGVTQVWCGKHWVERHTQKAAAPETTSATALVETLGMIYDKWENGTSCYEDPEDCTGYLGNAVKLTQAEEAQILALLPLETKPTRLATDEIRNLACCDRFVRESASEFCAKCGYTNVDHLRKRAEKAGEQHTEPVPIFSFSEWSKSEALAQRCPHWADGIHKTAGVPGLCGCGVTL